MHGLHATFFNCMLVFYVNFNNCVQYKINMGFIGLIRCFHLCNCFKEMYVDL